MTTSRSDTAASHGITYPPPAHGQTACSCGGFRARWESPTQRATAIVRGIEHITVSGYNAVDSTTLDGRTTLMQGMPLGPPPPPTSGPQVCGIPAADRLLQQVQWSSGHPLTTRDRRIVRATLRGLADYTALGDACRYQRDATDDVPHSVGRWLHAVADQLHAAADTDLRPDESMRSRLRALADDLAQR